MKEAFVVRLKGQSSFANIEFCFSKRAMARSVRAAGAIGA
jgi:hypothetical protein